MQTSTDTVTCVLCNATCFIEDFSLLGCDAALLVEHFLMFLRITVPYKCWIYTPNTVSHPRRLKSSATTMGDPPVSHMHGEISPYNRLRRPRGRVEV